MKQCVNDIVAFVLNQRELDLVAFGMSVNSRTKVGQFLKRMEEMGYISTHKEDTVYEGKVKSRLYIVVNDPNILKGS